LRGAEADERGSAPVEMAIIFPVTAFLVFAIIQVGVWYHAAQIARAAAQEGARAASAYNSTPAAGAASAQRVLSENANGLIEGSHVTPSRDSNLATVTVTGHALQVIPFIPLPVRASATAPVEAFRPPPRS